MTRWSDLQKHKHIVIGMIHIPALPGSPLNDLNIQKILEIVLRDAKNLVQGGVHALMMENFGDVPFTAGRVGVETVAMMTMIANEVQKISKLPLGINVLRNDGESALAIALAAGADFIRVNILTGARVTDQGVIQGNAFDLLRMRKRLEAQHIAVLADVDVKHSVALASRALKDEVEDTLKRGLADGLIVSGAGTGKKTDPKKVQEVAEIAKGSPVFLGSGIDVDNVSEYGNAAKGFIVGTHFKKNSAVAEPVELSRVQAFMKMLNNL